MILSTFISPLRSGAEACAEEVSKDLQHRYTITIISARMRRDLPKHEMLHEKVTIRRIGFGTTYDKWLYPFMVPFVITRYKPDLVHAVLESFAGIALIFCRLRFPYLPSILTCQNTYTNYKGKIETKWLLKPMHSLATRVTVLSQSLYKRAEALRRPDAMLIPNGVRLADVPKRTPIFGRIIYVGRLEPIKGIDTLLKAFALLPPHAHLRIIGDGSLRQELEIQASMLTIKDRVTFVGPKTSKDVLLEFAEAEIFCGLSRSEAFGNVFIEAQATECAIVATNVDGIPDIITDGVTGLLVPPDDVEAAAKAMTRLLNNQELRESLAAAAVQNAQKYDWGSIANQYAAIYESLLH